MTGSQELRLVIGRDHAMSSETTFDYETVGRRILYINAAGFWLRWNEWIPLYLAGSSGNLHFFRMGLSIVLWSKIPSLRAFRLFRFATGRMGYVLSWSLWIQRICEKLTYRGRKPCAEARLTIHDLFSILRVLGLVPMVCGAVVTPNPTHMQATHLRRQKTLCETRIIDDPRSTTHSL
jgi:hypothetical protein